MSKQKRIIAQNFSTPLQCANKRTYSSRHEATQVAEDQMNLHLDIKLRVYKCPQCNHWHLTKDKVL